MTKIYLIDDDPSILTLLSMIIEDKELGQVCGSSQDATDALEDLPYLKPDILIVDLLMPDMDGINLVRKAKEILPDASYIMLSQVSSKDMISKAYDMGVEFFIQKPVNAIEVRAIIDNVIRKRQLQSTVDQVQSIFAGMGGNTVAGQVSAGPAMGHAPVSQTTSTPSTSAGYQTGPSSQDTAATSSTSAAAGEPARLRPILRDLGLSGEIGYEDIINVVTYFAGHEEELSTTTLKEICSRFSQTPKSMEQRIRRTITAGLSNLAHLGLDDFGNDVFNSYAGSLYNFEQVRREMDFIQGKSEHRGVVRIKKFIAALVNACRE